MWCLYCCSFWCGQSRLKLSTISQKGIRRVTFFESTESPLSTISLYCLPSVYDYRRKELIFATLRLRTKSFTWSSWRKDRRMWRRVTREHVGWHRNRVLFHRNRSILWMWKIMCIRMSTLTSMVMMIIITLRVVIHIITITTVTLTNIRHLLSCFRTPSMWS